jgi:hypothetical protein
MDDYRSSRDLEICAGEAKLKEIFCASMDLPRKTEVERNCKVRIKHPDICIRQTVMKIGLLIFMLNVDGDIVSC